MRQTEKRKKLSRIDMVMLFLVIISIAFIITYILHNVYGEDVFEHINLPIHMKPEGIRAVLGYIYTEKNLLTAELVLIFGIPYVFTEKLVYMLRRRRYRKSPLSKLDKMDGIEFEHYALWILKLMGYKRCQVTKASGDFGADVVAIRNNKKTVVQVKRYKGNVGIAAVQQVVASKAHYGADEAAVFTNSHLTSAAKTLAQENKVTIIDRDTLYKFGVKSAFRRKAVRRTSPW